MLSQPFRKLVALLVLVSGALVFISYSTGITPYYVAYAPQMLVGFSVKNACSLKYISQFSNERIREDIAIYSPLFNHVKIDYFPAEKKVVASLLWEKQSAQYRNGMGCTLINQGAQPDSKSLDLVAEELNRQDVTDGLMSMESTKAPRAIDGALQRHLDTLLQVENKAQKDKPKGWDTRALLVMNVQGEILAESYAGGYDGETRFLGWSMTKTFTGIWAGVMERQGLIDIQQKSLFPEWQDQRAQIRIIDLLTMTSGLNFEEVYQPGTDATRMLFADYSVVNRPIASPLNAKPGENWQYSSGSSNMLAHYLHTVLGGDLTKTLSYIEENLLKPLKMTSVILEPDPSGGIVGSSFMFATAEDWAKMGVLLLNNGRVTKRSVNSEVDKGENGLQLLSPNWVSRATEPNPSTNDSRFGYQLWLNAGTNDERKPLRWNGVPEQAYAALGNRGQAVMVIPEMQWVVVRLGWAKGEYPKGNIAAKIVAPFVSPE